jgi:hypothetical protein
MKYFFSTLDHHNIVKLYGISIESKVFLVSEFMSNGNLLDYLQSRGRGAISERELLKYC